MSEPVSINAFAPGKPHDNQLSVINDPSRFKVLRAGRKWRKTSLGISWLIELALMDTRQLTYGFILPQYNQARESVWNDHVARFIRELDFKGFPYKKNETEMSLAFPGRGRLKLYGSDNPDPLRSISNWGAVCVDEYDDCSPELWSLIIRPNLMTHAAPAMLMGTPKGERLLKAAELDPTFKSFHYTSYDNPELDLVELQAMVEEYKAKGEDWSQQEIMAEYITPVGLVYKEWRRDNVRNFAYDPNLPVHISWDFGVNDPTSIIWIQKNGGEYRVIDYYEASNGNIDHFVQVVRSKPYKEAELHTGDPAGKARTLTTGTSPIDILAKAGIHVRVKQGVKIPEQIRATHRIIPSLFVSTSPNCERFIQCLRNYRYPPKNSSIINQENEIPIHDQYSHAMRALEYYAVNIADYQDSSDIVLPKSNVLFSKTGY